MAAALVTIIPLNQVPRTTDAWDEPLRPIVLVVDDEVIIADTVCLILSKAGFAAIPAYSGEAALDMARLVAPHLLLTDVSMPGMNGVQLGLAVGRLCPDCKILLFSGHAAAESMLRSAPAPRFELLNKPLHPLDLLDRIGQSLGMGHFAPAFA